jgi:hypothetical protein
MLGSKRVTWGCRKGTLAKNYEPEIAEHMRATVHTYEDICQQLVKHVSSTSFC